MADDDRQRACSWCGSANKLTREHVVPAWLGRELQRQFPDDEIGARYRLGGAIEAKVWEDAKPFSLTVKKFCYDCNNGWMSQLETDVKGFLLPLVNGADHTLTPEGQSIIAAWCFKTACVYDLVGQGDYVPSEHRKAFFRTLQPPPGVVVHLAPRSVGLELPPIIQHRLRQAQFESGAIEAYKAVLAIGHVVAQVIGFPAYESAEGTEDMAAGATRIWPTATEVTWPGQLRRLSVEDTLAYTHVEVIIS